MAAGTPLFPIYCGRVRITAGVNDEITFDEGGGNLLATIATDPTDGFTDYFLSGKGTATDLALAIKTAMDLAGGQVYTVTVEHNETTGAQTALVRFVAAGAFTMRFSIVVAGTLSSLELGFPVADIGPSTNLKGPLSLLSVWMPDQPIVKIDPEPDEVPAVEKVTPGNRVFVYIGGVVRTPRLDELRLVNDDRTWKRAIAADEARSFQSWWNVVNDAREIEVYHADDPTLIVAAELVGTFRLRGDAISRMPRPVRPGRANLYNFDLPLRNFVA